MMLDPKEIFKPVACEVGQKATFSKTIEPFDVYEFAGISGDFNPAHLNEIYGNKSMFKQRIAHGMIIAGLISGALTMKTPGAGTVVKKQSVAFKKPVLFNDTITVNLEVLEKTEDTARIATICTNQNNEEVVTGEVTVKLPRIL